MANVETCGGSNSLSELQWKTAGSPPWVVRERDGGIPQFDLIEASQDEDDGGGEHGQNVQSLQPNAINTDTQINLRRYGASATISSWYIVLKQM